MGTTGVVHRVSALTSITISSSLALMAWTGCTGTIDGLAGQRVGAISGIVWPLSGTTQPAVLSSTFGPRIRGVSDDYDFHRGIDMPVPEGSPVRAVADGEVRVGGYHSDYDEPIVQLMHCVDPEPPAVMDDCQTIVHTNYQHLQRAYVSAGDKVWAGEVIGASGKSAAGVPHLHFEVRHGSLYQRSAIHPLQWLPHPDSGPPDVVIDSVDFTDPTVPVVALTVTRPPGELDFVRVEVELFAGDNTEVMSSQSYDMVEWNQLYTEDDDPNVYLDDPTFNDVTVEPESFNAEAELYAVHFRFRGLVSRVAPENLRLVARAVDVDGNVAETSCAPCQP